MTENVRSNTDIARITKAIGIRGDTKTIIVCSDCGTVVGQLGESENDLAISLLNLRSHKGHHFMTYHRDQGKYLEEVGVSIKDIYIQ